MADPKFLESKHHVHLLDQLSEHDWQDPPRRRSRRRLAEHFDRWRLVSLAPLDEDEGLTDRVAPTGLVHHQIRRGKRVEEFALSDARPDRRGVWKLRGVVNSPLANRISLAIRFVDATAHIEGETARLLLVPELQVIALWLSGGVEGERVVVVNHPPGRGWPAYRRFHSPEKFVARLARRSVHELGGRLPARASKVVPLPT